MQAIQNQICLTLTCFETDFRNIYCFMIFCRLNNDDEFHKVNCFCALPDKQQTYTMDVIWYALWPVFVCRWEIINGYLMHHETCCHGATGDELSDCCIELFHSWTSHSVNRLPSRPTPLTSTSQPLLIIRQWCPVTRHDPIIQKYLQPDTACMVASCCQPVDHRSHRSNSRDFLDEI